ncbi:MAG: hypothetical protein RBS19_08855 [Bacteroidales bacterium]|nr:hypothetical protein [Bacteroidales bacterium]
MRKRFVYELIVGIIMLIAVFLFGAKGIVALVLLSAHPFIGKKKADERESQLFNKIGNYTAGAVLLVSVIVYYFSDSVINGFVVEKNWFGLVFSAFLIAHGLLGLILTKKV